VDTGSYWSTFGQAVLFALFQIGGIGFIVGATLLLLAISGRFGLRDRLVVSESMGAERLGGVLGLVIRVTVFATLVEAIGAAIFYFRGQAMGFENLSIWSSIFLAVSAFNNCGMDLLGGFKSMTVFQGDVIILFVTALICWVGSTGFIVLADWFKKWSFKRLTLESKIVLLVSLGLVIVGMVYIFLAEYSQPATLGPLSTLQKSTVAFFQSVSTRTAGFAALDIGGMKPVSWFILVLLMFIGGAAGSTAGGVKVNTIGVLIITIWSVIKGKGKTEAFKRQLAPSIIIRAITLFIVYLTVAFAIILVLSFTEVFPFDKIVFETFSALGTVGLSTGITPELSVAGRIIITITMFIGRLGPLALMAFLVRQHRPTDLEYPHENIRLG
jgi:trk system potassium uptake protein TrkH